LEIAALWIILLCRKASKNQSERISGSQKGIREGGKNMEEKSTHSECELKHIEQGLDESYAAELCAKSAEGSESSSEEEERWDFYGD